MAKICRFHFSILYHCNWHKNKYHWVLGTMSPWTLGNCDGIFTISDIFLSKGWKKSDYLTMKSKTHELKCYSGEQRHQQPQTMCNLGISDFVATVLLYSHKASLHNHNENGGGPVVSQLKSPPWFWAATNNPTRDYCTAGWRDSRAPVWASACCHPREATQ